MRVLLNVALIALAAGTAQAQAHDCPDPVVAVSQAEQAMVAGDFEAASAHYLGAQEAFACSPPADPALVARMWNAEGVRLQLTGDAVAAADAFQAAARLSPETWSESFGAELRSQRDEAAALPPRAPGTLRLEPEPGRFLPVLDGAEVELPGEAAAGLHLVQVLDTDGSALFARSVYVPSGELLVVQTGPLETRVGKGKRPFPWLLAAGGASVAFAGTAGYLATRETSAMRDASSISALDGAYSSQKLWNTATWSATGLAGACVGLHFLL